jgi:hypothetical protein
MKIALAIAVTALLGACAGDLGATGDDTDDCSVSISYTPTMPVAGPTSEVRLISTVTHSSGSHSYTWAVTKNGTSVTTTDAQTDGSEATFIADAVGPYEVSLDVFASLGGSCPQAHATVNVLRDATFENMRLHIVPPVTAMGPTVDRPLQIHDGTDFDMGAVVLELSTVATGTVRSSSGVGIPAYLQFYPLGMAGAMVETFAGSNGAFSARLLIQPHDVIVIPAATNIAPERLTNYSTTGSLPMLLAPDSISGSVHQGATPIAGARVQITIDGVPTTIGTTAANGTYTVLGHHAAPNKIVKVEITPPAASGLPRLEASGTINTQNAIDASYAGVTLRNLSGVAVRRGGSALPNRPVVIVGQVTSTSTIAGLSTTTGYVRIATITDAGGNLPSVLAPATILSAVTTVAQGDLAVGSVAAGTPAFIDAPAMTAISTTAGGGTDALSGVTLDLIPKDELAAANAPSLHFIGDAGGHVTGNIPTGGTYDVRWSDPQGRRGLLVLFNKTSLTASYTLPPAVYVSGDVTITGSTNPVVGASVQILCESCTGVDKTRPIAEVATDGHGSFTLAVPDPAAM